jgi:hypothetical protein
MKDYLALRLSMSAAILFKNSVLSTFFLYFLVILSILAYLFLTLSRCLAASCPALELISGLSLSSIRSAHSPLRCVGKGAGLTLINKIMAE